MGPKISSCITGSSDGASVSMVGATYLSSRSVCPPVPVRPEPSSGLRRAALDDRGGVGAEIGGQQRGEERQGVGGVVGGLDDDRVAGSERVLGDGEWCPGSHVVGYRQVGIPAAGSGSRPRGSAGSAGCGRSPRMRG